MEQKPYKQLTPDDFPPGEPVLKWKNGSWYRPNNCGYTDRITEAGLYTREEAIKYCFETRDGKLYQNGSCNVYAVPIRMAVASSGYTTHDIQNKISQLKALMPYVPESNKTGVTLL